MLAIAPNAPVMSLLAITNCSSTTAAMIDQRDDRRPERDPEQVAGLACADWPVVH